MNAADRSALQRLAEALPPGAAVPLPREWLLSLLASAGDGGPTLRYDTEAAARLLGVAPKTVASWCTQGRFPGARKTGGAAGKWTIPADAVLALAEGADPAHEEASWRPDRQ